MRRPASIREARPFPIGTTTPPSSARACRSCRAPTPHPTSSPRGQGSWPSSRRWPRSLWTIAWRRMPRPWTPLCAVKAMPRAAWSPGCWATSRSRRASPGLLRHLGWTVLARYLAPVVDAFGRWRDDERWLRHYCPTCGSAPAMAQLVGVGSGAQTAALVRSLRHTLAVQTNRMPVLRRGLSTAVGRGRRGRGRAAHRLLRVLQRLPEDVRRAGQRGPPALGLVFSSSRPHRPGSRTEEGRRVALRVRAGTSRSVARGRRSRPGTQWRRRRDYRCALRSVPYCRGAAFGGRVEPPVGSCEWRREGDSNSRYRFRYSGFQDRRLKPLGHPSDGSVYRRRGGYGRGSMTSGSRASCGSSRSRAEPAGE